jgi:CMP-N-acetylneuraminic acid synthetase
MSDSPTPTAVALSPARSGSKRVTGKNIRLLGGHPMIAYSIRAALDSGVFQRVVRPNQAVWIGFQMWVTRCG